ncbi:hypothetical protein [Pelosinus sp. IPA-1]|uniref:hypothetical protein n=1 Tax=Pelosinus sp. IPA-1 TaxID=3029569 RepID=UPI0024361FF1|nr:hypothetical protein [Pelosinus sp. IPA-1]GMA97348.1 hypothetical protein PIPA1_01480 [Pelosinus sp. IPA-1]
MSKKKEMTKQAKKIILLVDHFKFDKIAFIKILDYSDIDYLFTDREPTKTWTDLLQTQYPSNILGSLKLSLLIASTTLFESGACCYYLYLWMFFDHCTSFLTIPLY